jgi:hypothetical protein
MKEEMRMSRTSKTQKSFWKSLFKFLLYMVLIVAVVIGGWKITLNVVDEENREKMLVIEDQINAKLDEWYGDFLNLIGKGEKGGEVAFEGVKLSEATNCNLENYVDFTIPYTWTFGRIEVADGATEEAIAITGEDVVMSLSLRNVEVKADAESIMWTEEALLYELQNSYQDYTFTKADMFEDQVAIIEGVTTARDAKLYVVVIPAGEKSIFVSYSFLPDDWNADLYFTTAISEMLESK